MMAKTKKKELLSSAPWRGEERVEEDKFKDAKMSVTREPGSTPTMHYNKPFNKASGDGDSGAEIDPELRYSFQRNYQGHDSATKHPFGSSIPDGIGGRGHCFSVFIKTSTLCILPKFLQRVFSIDTAVKPLPPAMAYSVSRNWSFFTRIFTQFFDPDGILDAQKSIGLVKKEEEERTTPGR